MSLIDYIKDLYNYEISDIEAKEACDNLLGVLEIYYDVHMRNLGKVMEIESCHLVKSFINNTRK